MLSLGTGQNVVAYDAKTTSKWGALSWIYNNGNIPLFDILMMASQDIADYSMSNAFFEQSSQDNYLRIQVSKVSVNLSLLCSKTGSWYVRCIHARGHFRSDHIQVLHMVSFM